MDACGRHGRPLTFSCTVTPMTSKVAPAKPPASSSAYRFSNLHLYSLIPNRHTDPAAQLYEQGMKLLHTFERTGFVHTHTEAAQLLRKAVDMSLPGDSDLLIRYLDLGESYTLLFQQTGDFAHIDEAIRILERGIELTQDHDDLPFLLASVGEAFTCRHAYGRDLKDAARAVAAHRRAVAVTPNGHASLPHRLTGLGMSLGRRCQNTRALADVTESISILRRAVALTPPLDEQTLSSRLENLAVSYNHRFGLTGTLSDIDEAIVLMRKAVELTPPDHDDLPLRLSNLGGSLFHRFQRTEQPSDITESIATTRRALQLTPTRDSSSLLTRLTNLGASLARSFEMTGKLSEIDEGISVMRRAVDLTPQNHFELPTRLVNLGSALNVRFDRTNSSSDSTDALSFLQKAVRLTDSRDPELPSRFMTLGQSYLKHYDSITTGGDSSNITNAIKLLRRSVDMTPSGDIDLPARLASLGAAYGTCFKVKGDLSDAAEAISCHQKAVDLTPRGHPNLASFLSNLGISLDHRFERTGESTDVAEAVSAHRRAMELTPCEHANMPSRLAHLGRSLSCLFEKSGSLADITEATTCLQKAIAMTPKDHADLPTHFTKLGMALNRRFRSTGAISDVDEAIVALQMAIELVPQGYGHLDFQLANLAVSFSCRFEKTGRISDIDEAISATQRAIVACNKDYAGLSGLLTNLGSSYHLRFLSTSPDGGRKEDLKNSIDHYRSAATSDIGSPQVKLRAASFCARLLSEHFPHSPETLTAFDLAIRLLTMVAGLEQTMSGRYSQLQRSSGLAPKAAAAACTANQPGKALEWLEQGRCLVWSQLMHLRTPLDELRAQDPELAQQIEDTAKRLEIAGSSRDVSLTGMTMSEKISVEEEAHTHLKLARGWEELLATARAMPGFHSFLLPASLASLTQYIPDAGFIVVVNVDSARCDAIAIAAGFDSPIHIALPRFSLQKAEEYRRDLSTHLQSALHAPQSKDDLVGPDVRAIKPFVGKRAARNRARGIMSSLWDEVVKPILDALGIVVCWSLWCVYTEKALIRLFGFLSCRNLAGLRRAHAQRKGSGGALLGRSLSFRSTPQESMTDHTLSQSWTTLFPPTPLRSQL